MLHDFRYPGALRYRNVPEAEIVRFLCSPFELAAGRRSQETEAMAGLLNHLVALGLPFRQDVDGSRYFDLAEIVNFNKYAHFAWGEKVWLERSVGTMRRLSLREDIGAPPALPPDYSDRPPPEYAVTITRRFAPGALRPGPALRLNMPKPLNAIPGSHSVEWLRTDNMAQEPKDDGGRYTLKVRLDGPSDVVICARHRFIPSPAMDIPETDGADVARYLRHNEGLVVVTPQIKALAERLGLSSDAPRRSLETIWDYLFDEISFGFIHYDRLAPEDPLAWGLDNRRVDCNTGSALIVALCRAVGIPARMICGYTLHPVMGTSHTWFEVWFEGAGWTPFDTYAIDLAGDERSSPWRQHYFGRIDQRFVAEVLPTHFCGLGAPRLPRSWQLSMGLTDEGATTWFHDVETYAVIYSDTVAVEVVGEAPSLKASPLRPVTVTPEAAKSKTESPRRKVSS